MSKLTPKLMSLSRRLSDVQWDSVSTTLLLHEVRDGKGVLTAFVAGNAGTDLTFEHVPKASVLYGGGDFTVRDGQVVYVAENRLWRMSVQNGTPQPLTPAFGAPSSPVISPDGRWVVYVHSYEGQDVLAIVRMDGSGWGQILVQGDDFYLQPTWHPTLPLVACVAWNQPNMPWDATSLRLIELDPQSGMARQVQPLTPEADTSYQQPTFSPDGKWLAYLSDASGFGTPQLYHLERRTHQALTSPSGVDFCHPAWVQGQRYLQWLADGSGILAVGTQLARQAIYHFDLAQPGKPAQALHLAYQQFSSLSVHPISGEIACIASHPSAPARVIRFTLADIKETVVCYSYPELRLPAQLSIPQHISWQCAEGEAVHGVLYLPANSGKKPPLVVLAHGGPTSFASFAFDERAQFFTSRGWAALQVNYRGSAGYGRAYLRQLDGRWGESDISDCLDGARFLARAGRVNPEKCVIFGGSAGGIAVLLGLASPDDVFCAGICAYPVTDFLALAQDTHKFEARYTDRLVGKLPDSRAIYLQRSPSQ
ncbi:MAG TPA: prolyl oligopeptidase family serine peptidase, partial [Anaerolineales bacterium]|nr:prolyl oligopeptidase family serine peptidase [Anaerolineales bacterium]